MPSQPPADAPGPFLGLSTVAQRPVRRLCRGQLALGTLVLFNGAFGLGKSLVALDLLRLPGHTGALERALAQTPAQLVLPDSVRKGGMAALGQRGPVDHHLDHQPVTR